ncbi:MULTISPECIES: MATE family efflux transporter [Lentibacter]|jgi:multidrug resistance protein, MATE family|uniref:Multidrug resistance protein, MATE family n=1 Tax=Lentibacter algarum TaxID=576131 RepID=A0A1H3H7X0_9RHOB|nr:MATE family efflux transporter [Lentibacter algarum]MCO4777966.1 MATE family efflux transporter [Lentibacter algarum]WIF30702.1 DNA-damage-inducible protein F [Lentibacter algarum]SDY10874.1 multidrug resistance protein, MATE family [Lentibacter algarum]
MSDAIGDREITHRRVLKIAIPILLANVTIPILGAVDTAVVGQIPDAAPIAAVGVGAVIISAIYWVFGFLRMGTTGLTSQAAGRGEAGEVAALLTRALMIGVAGGLFFVLIQPLLIWGAFRLSPASAEVEGLAETYMRIRIFSAPAAIAMYGITGWLIAQERTREVLWIQLLMNGVNVGLDLVFVLSFGWGVAGVAWATFIAEWSGLVLGLWMCRAAFAHSAWRDWARVFDRIKLKRMAVVNSDILIRSLLLQGIFVSFLLLGGRFGDVTLAANQVLLQFLHITGYALDGFAFAAEALVGQAFGAAAVARVRRAAVLTTYWALALGVLMALAFCLMGPMIIDIMTKAPDVQQEARHYLPWLIAAPVMIVGLTQFDGIFIGATRTADMRNMMAIAFVIYVLAAWALMPRMENHGLWLALHISFIARAGSLALRYPALERAAKAG